MSLSFTVSSEKNVYELAELSRMFGEAPEFCVREESGKDRNLEKRELYALLSEATGIKLDWGILVGVRPGKLYGELTRKHGQAEAERILRDDYLVSDAKIELLRSCHETQMSLDYDRDPAAISLYVGIPFCPSRCLYCSFTSNKFNKDASLRYMDALEKEIKALRSIMDQKGMYAESIYIGGGTPTSLDDPEFERLLRLVRDNYKIQKTREWTVEAGRPDTITESKLALIKAYGADRISINPQSMKQRTLDLIGRSHSPEEIVSAFEKAHRAGIGIINADLIAGLPEESPEDFKASLSKMIELGANNITVHTLAVKKASRLIEEDPGLGRRQAETVRKMLDIASGMLKSAGFSPYYLYRQKNQAGNFENVGYCTKGLASVYNIRIMDENQSNLAVGAGAISKVYYPEENRLERVANVSNYEIYIERIDEMIERKLKGIL